MKKILLFVAIALSINVNAQNVSIPDANFKTYLVGNVLINTNADTEIQVSEATAFNGTIDCSNLNIADLTGIQDFSALTALFCQQNQLTTLDVTQNTALTNLECWTNQLTSLDVSQNTALTNFICAYNQLTSIDVTQNTALTYLECGANQLTSLDVSQNTALTELFCYEAQLTSLDVSQNTALIKLNCWINQLNCLNVKNGNNINFAFLYADGNPNLTCIEVDDDAYSTTNWTDIDAQASYSTNCNNACSSVVGVEELNTNVTKKLSKIIDLMGREIQYQKNTVMLYIHEDGSSERVFDFE